MVICVILLWRLVVDPVFSKISSLDKDIRAKETQIKNDLRLLAYKDRILSAKTKYASFLSMAQSEEEETASLLKEIEGMADKSSVYLIDMKPGGLKEAGGAKKYLVNLNCEAQVEQIIDFMYNVENSKKLLSVEKFQMTPKSKESSVARCSMTIAKIIMP
jgi:Tfp pilus assembly protein PilO